MEEEFCSMEEQEGSMELRRVGGKEGLEPHTKGVVDGRKTLRPMNMYHLKGLYLILASVCVHMSAAPKIISAYM